ncbi:TonB-dependent receptor [Danxiaibacter flavus]|uniref:TonB-dependent receptor n=1 Tax=Danxiaibacter flavus TaxID=3049108 RepID=A0ABV3ZGJ9_9BACT|nr:TonB-dependent receptor [Chitinophagaceae bacterium DXS]
MKRTLAVKVCATRLTMLKLACLLTGMLLFFAAKAGENQILSKTNVTIAIKSGSLNAAIKHLQQNTKIVFAYDSPLLSNFSVSDQRFVNERLDKVLNQLLEHTPLTFEEVNGIIVISRKDELKTASTFNAARKADIIVSGIVVDENNKPIEGVTVEAEGKLAITATDTSGKFKIIVPSQETVIVFSLIGYATEKVRVGNQTMLNIKMRPGIDKELEDVAVVAFGKQRKISLVGAQSTLKPAELNQPAANISTMLAGRIAGIVGVQRSGEPGKSAADIWIRGISTFGQGNSASPLILIDGVERDLNNVDPEDIESFTILKDASGTAVYGVRGANGVVVIKTKSGKVGKPQVYFDYNEGVNTFTKKPAMMDGVSYMHLANEALTTRNQNPLYSQEYIDKTVSALDPLVYPNVDWMDAILNKTGHVRKANINVSGGVENTQFYVSLSYYNEGSFLKTDELEKYNSSLKYNRYNFTSNLNVKITRTTKLDVGVQGYFSNGNYPAIATHDIFQGAMTTTPVIYPIMYPGGFVPGISPNGGSRNPYADLAKRGYRNEYENKIYSNVRLTQDLGFITKGLNITAMMAFDSKNNQTVTRSKENKTYTVSKSDPYNPGGTLKLLSVYTPKQTYLGYDRGNSGERLLYSEAAVNYDRSFNRHRVSGLALFYASDKTNAFGDYMTSIPEKYVGLAGRATYSFDDRYFAEFNIGYNGSELFSPNNRYGIFPAVGVGWVISNESFFDPVKNVVNFLKLRYSNGNSGLGTVSDANLRFLYLDKLNDNDAGYKYGAFNNVSGISITRYGTNVQWAISNKQDLGFEFRTLNNQLSLIVDVFKEHRKGIFLQRQSNVAFMGLKEQQYGNLGVVDNKGIDATLEYNTTIGKVNLGLRGNFTYNKDKLIENDMPPQDYPWMEKRGHNILARFGYIADGLFKDQKDIDNNPVPGGDKSKILPGDIRYKDLNSDGKIDYQDVAYIGRGDVPTTIYGFGFNVGYKAFNVAVLFQGIANADRHIGGSAISPFKDELCNVFEIAKDRWTPDNPNPHPFYPRLAYGGSDNTNNYQTSSWWVKDVSFMRLKSAMISYNLPAALLKRVGVKNSAIYLQGINLLTFSKFKLWDPELNSDNGTHYPNVRVISLGVNLKF